MLDRRQDDLLPHLPLPRPKPTAVAEIVSSDPDLSWCSPIHIRFRDNELYLTTLGSVILALRKRGLNVQYESFPRGTTEAEIDQALSESVLALQNSVYFSDYTSRRSWHVSVSSQKSIGIGVASTLDTICSEVVQELVRKKFGIDKIPDTNPEAYLNEYGRCVVKVMQEAFRTRMPSRLDILSTDVGLHLPFLKVHAAIPFNNKIIAGDLAKRALFGAEYPEEVLTILTHYYGFEVKSPAMILKDWMIQAGMPEDRIRMLKSPKDLLDPNFPLDGDVFVCSDQHMKAFDDRKGDYTLVLKLMAEGVDEKTARVLQAKFDSMIVLRQPIEFLIFDLMYWSLLGFEHGIEMEEVIGGVTEMMINKTIEMSAKLQAKKPDS